MCDCGCGLSWCLCYCCCLSGLAHHTTTSDSRHDSRGGEGKMAARMLFVNVRANGDASAICAGRWCAMRSEQKAFREASGQRGVCLSTSTATSLHFTIISTLQCKRRLWLFHHSLFLTFVSCPPIASLFVGAVSVSAY